MKGIELRLLTVTHGAAWTAGPYTGNRVHIMQLNFT